MSLLSVSFPFSLLLERLFICLLTGHVRMVWVDESAEHSRTWLFLESRNSQGSFLLFSLGNTTHKILKSTKAMSFDGSTLATILCSRKMQ